MIRSKKIRRASLSLLALSLMVLPAFTGCTIMDALDRRAADRASGKVAVDPNLTHVHTDDVPQDQRVTLYVLGVDGVD